MLSIDNYLAMYWESWNRMHLRKMLYTIYDLTRDLGRGQPETVRIPADLPEFSEVIRMKRSRFINSIFLTLAIVSVAPAQQNPPATGAPQTAQTPPQPVSISPAMPVVSAPPVDPGKMAEPAGGTKQSGMNVDPSYILGSGDTISVSVWGDPEFDGSFIIGPDGTISLKLVGEVRVAGLTRQEAQAAVDKSLLKEMRSPRSSVNLLVSNSKHVYFDGEGIAGGAMPLVMPTRLLEALSSHGGFKEFANTNKIRILRGGKPLTHLEGGKQTEFYRHKDMLSGKHPESNPLLQDGDHIIVP